MCLFRFKLWWMIPSFGDSDCEVPAETQMLLLETREKSTVQNGLSEPTTENSLCILLLPVLDGPFRASLQGKTVHELEFCIESGSFNLCNFILDVDQCGFDLFCLLILSNISEFCGFFICASGDPKVQTSQVTEAVFMNSD